MRCCRRTTCRCLADEKSAFDSLCPILQPQYILHGVETGFPLRQPLSGADGAAREGVATVGAVDEFETLADPTEDHRVFADDVAGTNGESRNFSFAALADDAFAAVDA